MFRALIRLFAFTTAALIPTLLPANHGPGTSGGGSSTLSGETLRQGNFDLSFRTDYTDFQNVSRREAQERAAASGDHGHFDTLSHSWLTTADLQYGVLDDLTVGAQIGYYSADDFVGAHVHEDGDTGAHTGDVNGLTDLWLTGKYRLVKGAAGRLAVLGGIKLPTGRDDEELSFGEAVEPSSQPGTRSVDYQAGLAYSRYLSPRVTLDLSGLYTLRTEHDDFKVGDRFDAGAAVNYRLTESVKQFPQFSVFGEVLYVWLDKDEEDGEREANSGGSVIYLSPGLRIRFNETFSATVAPAFPVVQDLNGEQVEVETKVAVSVSLAF